jgi:hypothetical protein
MIIVDMDLRRDRKDPRASVCASFCFPWKANDFDSHILLRGRHKIKVSTNSGMIIFSVRSTDIWGKKVVSADPMYCT